MFFKSLRNFLRCTFCTRRNCDVRYHIGARHYYSYLGFVNAACPKDFKKIVPFYGKVTPEITEIFEQKEKESEEKKEH